MRLYKIKGYVSRNSIYVAFSYEKTGVTVQKDALFSFLTSKMMGYKKIIHIFVASFKWRKNEC
jgi:hypothetical protein